MPRVTKSLSAKAKHKKVLNSTKGHYGARSRLYKTAKQSNIKSMQYAFRDRKILSDIAVYDNPTFEKIVQTATK